MNPVFSLGVVKSATVDYKAQLNGGGVVQDVAVKISLI